MLLLKYYTFVALCCIILTDVISGCCINFGSSSSKRKNKRITPASDSKAKDKDSLFYKALHTIDLNSENYIQKVIKQLQTKHKNEFEFLPVNNNWQIKKCEELKFKFQECVNQKPHKSRNVPINPVEIPGDGNCFFSALSYWISGSIEYGSKLRFLIVDFMTHSDSFKLMTKDDERNARILKMYNTSEFAESPEIAAAAEFLNTSIYIYTLYPVDGWHFISKNLVTNEDENEECIYLINYNEHYNVVIEVDPENKSRSPEDIKEFIKNIRTKKKSKKRPPREARNHNELEEYIKKFETKIDDEIKQKKKEKEEETYSLIMDLLDRIDDNCNSK
ncbi:uncharacterized protein LOC126895281 isoform X2 [Daktulosphaira vitifoliae]|uniref:uncharacterized protein LOC126895281 isoform X2 n=1 Tax=Daktulosphaira vitifoliae TaxID=58002 RepID=UPI0021AA1F7B|nr:uncharacterized protein LOC126895281 isoform X2 [Daktulosphaira vitifoliae]